MDDRTASQIAKPTPRVAVYKAFSPTDAVQFNLEWDKLTAAEQQELYELLLPTS